MFSCIRSFRRCWCEPWKTFQEAVRAFFTICGWVSYKILDSMRDYLEKREKNLLSLPSSVCQYGVNLHGFYSVQYSRNFTKYDWWSTCVLVGFMNSLCWPPFWERRVGAEHYRYVHRACVFFQCVELSGLCKMITVCSWGSYEFITSTSILWPRLTQSCGPASIMDSTLWSWVCLSSTLLREAFWAYYSGFTLSFFYMIKFDW